MSFARSNLCGLLLLSAALSAIAAESAPSAAAHVAVEPMKTSIYIGSVTLSTADFIQDGDTFNSTYEAKIRPWFFWSESGKITIKLPARDFARLTSGQTIDFTGEATNQKNKPRTVTGRAQPADPLTGKIKVRIKAEGIELIFNGTYRLTPGTAGK